MIRIVVSQNHGVDLFSLVLELLALRGKITQQSTTPRREVPTITPLPTLHRRIRSINTLFPEVERYQRHCTSARPHRGTPLEQHAGQDRRWRLRCSDDRSQAPERPETKPARRPGGRVSRLELVTRKESDVRAAVLTRIRTKLEALQEQVVELKQRISPHSESRQDVRGKGR